MICPSVIGFIRELREKIDPIELLDSKFILRNPHPEEIEHIEHIEHMPTNQSLWPDSCLLEVNEGIPADKFFGYDNDDTPIVFVVSGYPATTKTRDGRIIPESYADAVITRALTILRLYSPGNLSIRQIWMTGHRGYHFMKYSPSGLVANSFYGQKYVLPLKPADILKLESIILQFQGSSAAIWNHQESRWRS